MFVNLRMPEPLTSPGRENDQIQVHADGYGFAYLGEVWQILWSVHRTTQQIQFAHPEPAMTGEHGDAASVAVGEQVEALFVVLVHPPDESGRCGVTLALSVST